MFQSSLGLILFNVTSLDSQSCLLFPLPPYLCVCVCVCVLVGGNLLNTYTEMLSLGSSLWSALILASTFADSSCLCSSSCQPGMCPKKEDEALMDLTSSVLFSQGPRPCDTSNKLQEVQLPLVPLYLCQQLYGQTNIQPDMLCAGNIRDMKTACQGDSGSPLVCEFSHTWVQIGVVSWGKGCTYPMFPTVFARVSFFSRWIQHHIENIPLPLQPLPALSPTPGAIINVLMTSLAALSML
ncbi:hypothetical protein FD755_024070 [Muntiacus reevesi]|uniref:Peptidase S1 domain-containing protein n=1 Tax=Muntiacus reevesi TaxID=9886 RepID=A0A5N3VVM7_MUNRE|nr:hypothetical protein FD755_024070 [Muntiacus reevesi]